MNIIEIEYECTVAHRKNNVAGDSDYSHSTVERRTFRALVESGAVSERAVAEAMCDNYSGNGCDKEYRRIETRIGPHINMIVTAKGRL